MKRSLWWETSKPSRNTTRIDEVGALEASDALHRHRALLTQAVLRVIVVAALIVDLFVFPPLHHKAIALTVAGGYSAWSLLMLLPRLRRTAGWAPLVVDLAAFVAVLALSGRLSDPEWSSPIPEDAFLAIPLLAAFLLQPTITATAGICAALTYIVSIGVGHSDNPYWDSSLTHALFILVATAGGVLLSRIQQSRVQLIQTLVGHRSRLLAQVMSAEERERNDLAEMLHDGALQNVLAARHAIEEVALQQPSGALDHADRLLADVVNQLRSSMRLLHSEVLETSGLATSLAVLAEQITSRYGLPVSVDCRIPTAGPADRLLHRAAQELLTNAAKHADASRACIALRTTGPDRVELRVADDGSGITVTSLEEKLAAGHLGLASQRMRIEGAGGTFSIEENHPRGTAITVTVPLTSL